MGTANVPASHAVAAVARADAAAYRGDFVAWDGGCVLLGEGGGRIAPHAHYAIQIVLAAPSGLRVQFGEHGAWEPCAGAIVPSRVTHSIDVDACRWSAVIFVEPETAEGRALRARTGGRLERFEDATVAPWLERLHAAWRVDEDADAVASTCRALIGDLSATVGREPSDPRVLRAIEHIRANLEHPPSLEDVARVVHLSPDRFRHLFVAETGMAMRTYVVWRRFLQVWSLLMQGESLSAAAHAAGFSDSAHLSRTSRSMFGLAPSAMHMTGPLSRRARTSKS